MTIEQLVSEGRRLQRACNFLKPTGTGEPVAMWFEPDPDDESITDWRRWMTVRSDAVPQEKPRGLFYFSLYTSGYEKGLLDFVDDWPPRDGTRLYAYPTDVLPPIDAVFALGSEEVGAWLTANDWERTERYNSNFAMPVSSGNTSKSGFPSIPSLKMIRTCMRSQVGGIFQGRTVIGMILSLQSCCSPRSETANPGWRPFRCRTGISK